MAARPPRPCRKSGCSSLSREANGFCPAHQDFARELEAQRARRSDERRENAYRRGYTRNWRKVRDRHLGMHPLCEVCGCHRYEVLVVHHKDENPGNNTDDNLMTMCHNCHERHHGRKR